jgi:hypothetical protein
MPSPKLISYETAERGSNYNASSVGGARPCRKIRGTAFPPPPSACKVSNFAWSGPGFFMRCRTRILRGFEREGARERAFCRNPIFLGAHIRP